MGRQPCCEKVGLKKGPWTAEEDRKLIHYITSNGHGCWRDLNCLLARRTSPLRKELSSKVDELSPARSQARNSHGAGGAADHRHESCTGGLALQHSCQPVNNSLDNNSSSSEDVSQACSSTVKQQQQLVEEMPCSAIPRLSPSPAEPLITSATSSSVSSWQQLTMLLPPSQARHCHLQKQETDCCEVLSTNTTAGACVKQEVSSSPSLWEIINGSHCFMEEESTSSQNYFQHWSNVDNPVNVVNDTSNSNSQDSWPALVGVHHNLSYPEELQRLAAILDDM